MTSVKIEVLLFQAEDGIRDLVRSRGLGDVYKRQPQRAAAKHLLDAPIVYWKPLRGATVRRLQAKPTSCLLYTSDAADERSSVDLGGRRIIKKKKDNNKLVSGQHKHVYKT